MNPPSAPDGAPEDYGDNYKNYEAKPAIETVREYLDNFQSLRWIPLEPDGQTGIHEVAVGPQGDEQFVSSVQQVKYLF